MDFSENITAKLTEQTEENNKLISDLSLVKADYEKEQQMRIQFEKQSDEATKLMEMV